MLLLEDAEDDLVHGLRSAIADLRAGWQNAGSRKYSRLVKGKLKKLGPAQRPQVVKTVKSSFDTSLDNVTYIPNVDQMLGIINTKAEADVVLEALMLTALNLQELDAALLNACKSYLKPEDFELLHKQTKRFDEIPFGKKTRDFIKEPRNYRRLLKILDLNEELDLDTANAAAELKAIIDLNPENATGGQPSRADATIFLHYVLHGAAVNIKLLVEKLTAELKKKHLAPDLPAPDEKTKGGLTPAKNLPQGKGQKSPLAGNRPGPTASIQTQAERNAEAEETAAAQAAARKANQERLGAKSTNV